MATVNTLTSNTAFTDPNTVPTGCPILRQTSAITSYVITYGTVSPAGYAACAQLPAAVAVGNVLELFGDYANFHSVIFYPASGETIQNIPIGPFVGGLSVAGGSVRVLQKVTSTDWRILSSVS